MSQDAIAKDTAHAMLLIATIGAGIRDLFGGRVPNGEMYARVMGHVSLEVYQKCLDILKNTNLIKEENNVLIWIGPPKESHETANLQEEASSPEKG